MKIASIEKAIAQAKAVTGKPSIIKIKTTIGKGAKLQGTEKVHGAPLGAEDVAAIKTAFGFDPAQSFHVSKEVYDHYGKIRARGEKLEADWNKTYAAYKTQFPGLAAELERRFADNLPADWKSHLPKYTPSDPAVATRKLSEILLNKIAPVIPEFVGGSADLTHSNLTKWKGSVDFQAPSSGIGDYSGRYFRYGVREHGMAAISNGLAAYGGLIPFASTFLNFIRCVLFFFGERVFILWYFHFMVDD